MNKTELKKILKPLIKQCIKEVIFEDGTLSNIVSEVTRGLSTQVMTETQPIKQKSMKLESENDAALRLERKKRMLDSIGKDAYNGVDLFEGTTPAPPQREQGQGALSGVDPRDPGIDITKFASSGMWKKLAGN